MIAILISLYVGYRAGYSKGVADTIEAIGTGYSRAMRRAGL